MYGPALTTMLEGSGADSAGAFQLTRIMPTVEIAATGAVESSAKQDGPEAHLLEL